MRIGPAALLAGLVLLARAAGAEAPPFTPAQEAAFAAGDCARCHDLPDREPLERTESCVGCHRWIVAVSEHPEAREAARALFPKWDRYERNTHSYLAMPDLAAAMARLKPSWLRTWLTDPHDVRPGLPEGMPRFALSEGDLDALESLFAARTAAVPPTPPPDRTRAARGEALFTERGCVGCHAFGARHPIAALPLAPDLQHARDRMAPDPIAAWIRDPRGVSPTAQMPTLGLPEDEVLALRDYVLLGDPRAPPAPAASAPPAPLERPVAWAEVEERVFGRICVHCHMDPAQNEGRAGPGNDGGFGYPATGIELQTPEGVAAVADRIPDALLRRRLEAARDVVPAGHAPAALERPERPGMPLGLPPLSDEDIALVLAWIAQGMPR